MSLLYKPELEVLEYGFKWGEANVERCCANAVGGWVMITIQTPKRTLEVYVTKDGRIHLGPTNTKRMFSSEEWLGPKNEQEKP